MSHYMEVRKESRITSQGKLKQLLPLRLMENQAHITAKQVLLSSLMLLQNFTQNHSR